MSKVRSAGGSEVYQYQFAVRGYTVQLQPRVGTRTRISATDDPLVSQSVFTITEKAPTRAFSWLKAPTIAFTFKTL